MEKAGRVDEIGVRADANPFAGFGFREIDPNGSADLVCVGVFDFVPAKGERVFRDDDRFQRFPNAGSVAVDFERNFNVFNAFRKRRVGEIDESAPTVETGEEVGVRRRVALDRFVEPNRPAPERRAERVEFFRLDEPKIRVRATRARDLALERRLVQKFALRRVVATERDSTVPKRKVADYFEIRRARADSASVRGAKIARKTPKMPVHRRQKIGRRVDFANPRPFGVPAVRPVVTVRRFREAVKAPFPAVENRENNGTIIPAERPKRVVFRVRAVDSALRCYFGKLFA